MASEVKQLFEGKWTVFKSEDFDKFLDKMEVGYLKKKMAMSVTPTLTVSVEGETIKVGFLKKKMAMSVTPTLTVSVEGDTITVAFSAGPKTRTSSFKLATMFENDGEQPATAVSNFGDGKWITEVTPKDAKKKSQTITREIIDGNLVQTMVIEDVTCKRYFKRA